MTSRLLGIALAVVAVVRSALAQESEPVTRAQAAYNELDYTEAIRWARQALQEPPRPEDRIVAYELLGFSYGALDSTRQAVDAFERLIFLAPDREPDVVRVSPRITSLYALALGRVLVVRKVYVDSAEFVAGTASVPIGFEVSRTAWVETRLVGPEVDARVDTQTVAGRTTVHWTALLPGGKPVPPGRYRLFVTARESDRASYAAAPVSLSVQHRAVDTLPLLPRLPGYAEQPELVRPPRDFTALALSVFGAGLAGGAVLLVSDGSASKASAGAVGAVAVLTGLAMSLRRPDPQPSSTNILYNRLVRELLARRNAEIHEENLRRGQQVLLTVRPAP